MAKELACNGVMPTGLTGDEKLKFNDCGATLGETGAIVESAVVLAGLGNCGGAGAAVL